MLEIQNEEITQKNKKLIMVYKKIVSRDNAAGN